MLLTVVYHKEIASGIFELTLQSETKLLVKPGQFLHVQVAPATEHVLRRPISIAEVKDKELTLLYQVVGKGTKALTRLREGAFLDALGPLGTGFPVEKTHSALLVGGGIGAPPLYELAKRLAKEGVKLTIALGFRTRELSFFIERFSALGEVLVSTNDGTLGAKGFITEQLPEEAEIVYGCGPLPLLRVLQNRYTRGYLSLEEHMACGVGACYGCTCGNEGKRVCLEGPVFPLKEVTL